MCIRDRPTAATLIWSRWRSAVRTPRSWDRSGLKTTNCASAAAASLPLYRKKAVPVSYTHLDVYKRQDLIRYFDMFAGIGGFRSGLTRAGGFRCVGHCEIDKYANASYQAIYEPGKEERYYPDATQIDPADLPDFDLLCGGFPCQAFSNAGRRRGFADARGTLFFEIARLAQAKRPAYLLLENVPYALQHIRNIMNRNQLCIAPP